MQRYAQLLHENKEYHHLSVLPIRLLVTAAGAIALIMRGNYKSVIKMMRQDNSQVIWNRLRVECFFWICTVRTLCTCVKEIIISHPAK